MPLREDPTYHVGGLTKKRPFYLSLAPHPTLPILDFISNASFYLSFLRYFLLHLSLLKAGALGNDLWLRPNGYGLRLRPTSTVTYD